MVSTNVSLGLLRREGERGGGEEDYFDELLVFNFRVVRSCFTVL